MADAFDPYVEWLGIRDPRRPVDHYRLLGVEPFTADVQLLAAAADRRVAAVYAYRAGPYVPLADRLLAELAAARTCLLHPALKAEYDRRLRASIGGQSLAPVPPPGPLAPPVVSSGPPLPPPLPPSKVKPAAANASWAVALLTAVVLVLIGATAFLVTFRRRPSELATSDQFAAHEAAVAEPPVREVAPEPSGDPEHSVAQTSTVSRASVPVPKPVADPQPTARPEPKPEPKLEASREAAKEPQPLTKLESGPAPKPEAGSTSNGLPRPLPPGPSPATGEGSRDASPEPKAGPTPERKVETRSVPPPAPAKPEPKLPSVPSEADLLKAQAEVQRNYGDELQSDAPETRLELARRLAIDALGERTDLPLQYALFSQALDVAVDLGAVKMFGQIVERMCDRFAVDGFAIKVDKVCQNARHARPAEANQVLAKLALELAVEATTAEKYADGVRLGEVAREMARRAKDTAQGKQAAAVLRDLIARQEAQTADAKAAEILARDPNDPRANLVRGKYLCFARGNWDAGLPYLERGSDPALRRLAAAERKPPGDGPGMATLADQWWDALKLLDESTQPYAKRRAIWWYEKALPELTGPAKSRAKKRADEAEGGGRH
jgi:hypothetical protein